MDRDEDLHFHLTEARSFLDRVRESRRRRGKTLSGRAVITDQQKLEIRRTVESSALLSAIGTSPSMRNALAAVAERVEEMCRREHLEPSAHLRPYLARLIGCELWQNSRAFGLKPSEVVSVTAYNGDVTFLLSDPAFSSLQSWRVLFKHALTNYPADPQQFITTVLETSRSLAQDIELKAFRDRPSVFMEVAISYPTQAHEFLQSALTARQNLESDPEFADFRDTPGIFTNAVISHHFDPRDFLRKVRQASIALSRDPEFDSLRDRPNLFRIAAEHYSRNPRRFLRGQLRERGPHAWKSDGLDGSREK